MTLSPGRLLPLAVDKSEGFVKDKNVLSGVCDTACRQRRLRTKPLVSHTESPTRGANRSTNHRYGLDCDHDSSMRTSSRRVGAEVENTLSCFPRRVSAVFCTDQSGCEGAHSVLRSSFRRPRPMSGCPRSERSPDTWCWCAASRRVVPIICVLPPPWPRLSPCGGSGASTACEILHPDG